MSQKLSERSPDLALLYSSLEKIGFIYMHSQNIFFTVHTYVTINYFAISFLSQFRIHIFLHGQQFYAHELRFNLTINLTYSGIFHSSHFLPCFAETKITRHKKIVKTFQPCHYFMY